MAPIGTKLKQMLENQNDIFKTDFIAWIACKVGLQVREIVLKNVIYL